MREIARRLNAARAPAEPLESVVLCIAEPLAFTCLGSYVYVRLQAYPVFYTLGCLNLSVYQSVK